MTLPPHIAKLRDELAAEWGRLCSKASLTNVTEYDYAKGFDAGFAEAKKQAEGLVDLIKDAEGYIFYLTQPDRGDVFGEWDDKHKKALAAYREKMGE